MAELIKLFLGVPDGKIYPVEYKPGDQCPPELEAGARELGALAEENTDPYAGLNANDLKAKLDEKKVEYKGNASKAELIELLKSVEAK
jgi:hypothetical protein